MNITKAIAEQVATKMVKPIAECISNEHDMLNDIVKDIAVRGLNRYMILSLSIQDSFIKQGLYTSQTVHRLQGWKLKNGFLSEVHADVD